MDKSVIHSFQTRFLRSVRQNRACGTRFFTVRETNVLLIICGGSLPVGTFLRNFTSVGAAPSMASRGSMKVLFHQDIIPSRNILGMRSSKRLAAAYAANQGRYSVPFAQGWPIHQL